MIYRHFKIMIPFGKRGKEKYREINGSGISNCICKTFYNKHKILKQVSQILSLF